MQPRFGKTTSEQTRRKISERAKISQRGRIHPELRGKKLSAEHKAKDSEAMLGMKFWNNGRVNVRARECPEGFTAGRMKRST